jgi:hypothetical protein
MLAQVFCMISRSEYSSVALYCVKRWLPAT